VVFDFGGNVGVHYYAYRKYLSYPDDLTWIVSELPAMAQRGREIARGQSAAARLSFVEDLTDLARADVFLAAGVLQYLPAFDLAGALGSLARKIPNLIFNKLPLYAGERFVTLQNAGSIVLPQHVWNRAQFLEPLERIGYELVDSWNVAGYSCLIPFHPEQSVPMYSGLYMRLR
jgi:putative methyltransferase (TIGR04325 family)